MSNTNPFKPIKNIINAGKKVISQPLGKTAHDATVGLVGAGTGNNPLAKKAASIAASAIGSLAKAAFEEHIDEFVADVVDEEADPTVRMLKRHAASESMSLARFTARTALANKGTENFKTLADAVHHHEQAMKQVGKDSGAYSLHKAKFHSLNAKYFSGMLDKESQHAVKFHLRKVKLYSGHQ